MFYNPQANIDRINAQIAELEKLKSQVPNIQPITQNFQLAPQNAFRYANNIDDVQKEYVVCDTPFFSKDLSVLWVKNTNGEIRTFELNEVIQKDEKDLQIEFLQAQIDELKKGRYNDYNANNEYGRRPGFNSYGDNYSRRGVDSKYRGYGHLDRMYSDYGRYEDYRDRYGSSEDTKKSLKYMLESMEDFAKMLKEEAQSQEEIEMIRQTAQRIAQM